MIIDAFGTGRSADAASVLFDYFAATQEEAGRPRPDDIEHLPAPLRAECQCLESAYAPPGVFLLATQEAYITGCAGMTMLTGTTAEMKRLWVYPEYRRAGVGTALERVVRDHSKRSAAARLVVSVMTSQKSALEFYADLGYEPCSPFQDEPYDMVYPEIMLQLSV